MQLRDIECRELTLASAEVANSCRSDGFDVTPRKLVARADHLAIDYGEALTVAIEDSLNMNSPGAGRRGRNRCGGRRAGWIDEQVGGNA